MTTFKPIVLKHHRKKDGTYNIKIRVTQNREKRYIKTPYFCTSADITRSFQIKSAHYLDLCRDIIDDFRRKLEPFGMAVLKMSPDKIVEICTHSDEHKLLFSEILDEYIKIRGIEQNTINGFIVCLNSLKKFFNVDDIDLCALNSTMLQKWVSSINPNTANAYSIKLSTLYNYVIKTRNDYENNIIVIHSNPFDKVILPEKSAPVKKAINVEQLRKIISYHSENDLIEFSRNMMLLSFYLVGMNLADIYNMTKEDLMSDYLEYNRQKTKKKRTDLALIRIKVFNEAKELVPLVYDTLHRYSLSSLTAVINKYLKDLSKELDLNPMVFYTARHTWATLAVNDCSIDKYTVHLALNHVDSKTAITDVYIKKDFSIIDKANRKVIDYVLGKIST